MRWLVLALASLASCSGCTSDARVADARPPAFCPSDAPGLGLLCGDKPASCASCTCLPCADPTCDKWCQNPCWQCEDGVWKHGDPGCLRPCTDAGP